MHLKRQKVPKNWPIKRKGTKFVVRPNFSIDRAIPLLITLRDILKIAQNRKEVKRAIHLNHVFINGRKAKDEKNSMMLFDTLSLIPMKKHYRLELSDKGKFKFNEIKEKESLNKISKILDKKVLKGKKTQLNLSDGRNFLSEIKCNVKDSVLVDLKNKKIVECLPLKEKSNVIVFSGKHAGKKGKINKMIPERKMAEINFGKTNVNVLTKQLMAIK